MTKAEQARNVARRLRILQHTKAEPRQVARTCRYFGISRTVFYRWKWRIDEFGKSAWPIGRAHLTDHHGQPLPRW